LANPSFPQKSWQTVTPKEAGIDPDKLVRVRNWLDRRVEDRRYRFALVRGGKLVAEWNHNLEADIRIGVASTWKSMLSNVLGIVVAEGRLPSAEAAVYDYWPEYMDVPEGEGPKDGRYAFAKDRSLTFAQLISNTSGYMKPGEDPGTVFHYQSYGMCILSHALANLYGYYDTADPQGSAGFGRLLQEKLAAPLGVQWEYSAGPMDLHPKARQEIFCYSTRLHTTALDLARAGWLWCNYGRWGDQQLVPEDWMRRSVQVAPQIKKHGSEKDWLYGRGFWSNSEGGIWPGLPRAAFHSWGAGGHYAAVFPGQELVIVQNPDPLGVRGGEGANPELVELVLDACTD
jgi:CubicO group peptidase (beta-lactamase class C family)